MPKRAARTYSRYSLQALALACVFKQRGLFKAEAVDGFLQVLVLLTDMTQVNIVLPEIEQVES